MTTVAVYLETLKMKNMRKITTMEKNFDVYINKSKTIIYKDDNKTQYKHFELIDYLNKNYYDIVKKKF